MDGEPEISGVTLGSRKKITSKVVISNADLEQTLSMVASKKSINDIVRRRVSESEESPSLFILYLGVDMQAAEIEKKTGWYYPEININKALDRCIFITSQTLHDKTIAPKGTSIIQSYMIFPHRYDEVKDWMRCKEDLEKQSLSRLEAIIPGLNSRILVKDSATAKTVKDYTGNNGGAAYGWALKTGQYERNRDIEKNLNKNLMLAGHWTNPGGGIVAVSLSGYNTAKKICLKYAQ